jgi:hypothetical protein
MVRKQAEPAVAARLRRPLVPEQRLDRPRPPAEKSREIVRVTIERPTVTGDESGAGSEDEHICLGGSMCEVVPADSKLIRDKPRGRATSVRVDERASRIQQIAEESPQDE